jgi:cell division protein FtsB
MASRNRKNSSTEKDCISDYGSKMQVLSKRLDVGVRFGFCVLVLMGCSAFMVAALPHQRKLEKMKLDLAEVQAEESAIVEQVDAKNRELKAIESDTRYREIIARDRLNYYEPGEHIFRIER